MATTGIFVSHEKVLVSPLLLVLEVWDGKPTYRKSWAGNLLVWSDWTWLLLQDQTRKAKPKSAHNSLIIGPRWLQCEMRSWAGNHMMWSDLTLDPSFKVKWGYPNLKVLRTDLLLVLEVWDGKPTYRKSWAKNHLMWSDLALDPSLKVNWGYPNLKVLITHLLLVIQVWDGKPTYSKSWAKNLLVWSDLTLDPSFKVKWG